MRIHLTSALVDDQTKALRFYTEVLGLQNEQEVPLGDDWWLTVVIAVFDDTCGNPIQIVATKAP